MILSGEASQESVKGTLSCVLERTPASQDNLKPSMRMWKLKASRAGRATENPLVTPACRTWFVSLALWQPTAALGRLATPLGGGSRMGRSNQMDKSSLKVQVGSLEASPLRDFPTTERCDNSRWLSAWMVAGFGVSTCVISPLCRRGRTQTQRRVPFISSCTPTRCFHAQHCT